MRESVMIRNNDDVDDVGRVHGFVWSVECGVLIGVRYFEVVIMMILQWRNGRCECFETTTKDDAHSLET